MNQMKCFKGLLLLAGVSFFMSSCSLFGNKGGKPTAQNPGQVSTATGLKYNEADGGGFAVNPYDQQPDAPNMVFIGGILASVISRWWGLPGSKPTSIPRGERPR